MSVSMQPGMGFTLLRAFCKLVAAGGCVFFTYFIWDWLNDAFYTRFATIYDTWGIRYPYSGDLKVNALDAYDASLMLFTWLPILVAALATCALRAIPEGTVPSLYIRARRLASRVLSWQLPPRRFWTWWSGGMSVGDFILVGWLIANNFWYFWYYFKRYDRWLDAVAETGVAYYLPLWQLWFEKLGIIFGIMLWPNIWLLFFPVPQSSFLQWLTGLGYSQMIRYHRWIGHFTMWVTTFHGWFLYIFWIAKKEFWKDFSDWGEESSINFLAGSIAYIFGLVLWFTSLQWVRRNLFEVFYRLHIVCFLGFTFFSYIHYFWAWSMFLPGLLLYAVDLALRAGQLTGTTLVTAAHVDDTAGVATLQLKTARSMKGCPVHELFMLVPSISKWQWHPITVAGAHADEKSSSTTLTLHIKTYGKWTKDLFARLRRSEPLAVRLSAPEGPDHYTWKNFGSVLLIGGGIGVTPLLAMLREAIAKRREDPSAVPASVRLVWICRQPREFCIMDPEILDAARDPSGWLSIDLHCTGTAADAEAPSDKDSDKAEMSSHGSADGMDLQTIKGSGGCPLHSPMFHKNARVIQPQSAGPLHYAVVYVLAWVGALLGTYLGGCFVGESYTYWDSSGTNYPNIFYSNLAIIWFFTQAIMSVGLPFALAVAPMHLWKYWRATTAGGVDELLPLVPAEKPSGHGAGSTLANGMVTASGGEAGLTIASGRPSLRAALEEAGAAAAQANGVSKGVVGVFVGGPDPMTRQVLLDVSSLNDRCGGPQYEFKALAHML